jgi:hypothetical protein
LVVDNGRRWSAGLAGLAVGCATGGRMAAQKWGERGLRDSVVVSGAEARSALAGP